MLADSIKEQVTLYQILIHYKIDFIGGGFKEQISCPFHGDDLKKSARLFPDTDTLFCWTCNKVWDVIEFVKDKEYISFDASCVLIQSLFNVKDNTTEYQKALLQAMQVKDNTTVEDISFTVERLFIRFVNDYLTNDKFFDKIEVVNMCWKAKDNIDLNYPTIDNYKNWLSMVKREVAQCLIKQE
jgi:hypothetical protein